MAFRDVPGATYLGDGRCRFSVWAPRCEGVAVHLLSPEERVVPLAEEGQGYYGAVVEGVVPGVRYLLRPGDGKERPDPASRYQPEGLAGPSQVVAPEFIWEDDSWHGLLPEDYVLYELHVGTFTEDGSFEAVVPHLERLAGLGITAIELMPVAQFPGERNWGYDGAYPYAVQNSYGGPEGLKRLVNACHTRGLAVVLDVVYNHLGPEGNYLAEFGPYFTDKYHTPWGAAINFDGWGSDEVRHYFIQNALYWIREFHIDGLRLDAVHGIIDQSPVPFLSELQAEVGRCGQQVNRRVQVFAESPLNDPRLVLSKELGGKGLDGLWNEDFHHALHSVLTGERQGYYMDYGAMEHLTKAFREGFVYTGEYSCYRGRRHGASSRNIPGERLVVFAQNHDQVGNRLYGERLSKLVPFEALKVAAGLVLMSPFVPLLFMGEEYGEVAPFPYFISHSDPALVDAVRQGRKEEFRAFEWRSEPPDPQAEETFRSARLDHTLRERRPHCDLERFYRELLRLRRARKALSEWGREKLDAHALGDVLVVRRWHEEEEVAAVFHFGRGAAQALLPLRSGRWGKLLDSSDNRWGGPGGTVPGTLVSDNGLCVDLSPLSVLVLAQEK